MTNRKKTADRIYKVIFLNQGETYEVFARGVSHGDLFGFVEIEELVFGEKTTVVVDPSEERLKSEFAGVRRFYVPLHAVVRIDEVEKKAGAARVTAATTGDDKVAAFPTPIYTPGVKPPKK